MSADPGLEEVFRAEARDTLAALSRRLLELESAPAAGREELVRALFRHAHTLKGAASSAGFEAPAQLAHALESSLERLRSGVVTPSRALIDAAFGAVDLLQRSLDTTLTADEVAQGCSRLATAVDGSTTPVKRRRAKPGRKLEDQLSDLFTLLAAAGRGTLEAGGGALAEAAAGLEAAFPEDRPDARRLVRTLSEFFARCRDRGVALAGDVLAPALMAVDLLQGPTLGAAEADVLIRKLAALPADPVTATPDRAAAPVETFVRVPVAVLDSVLFRLDELVALKLRLDFQRRQVEELQHLVAPRGAQDPAPRTVEGIRRGLTDELHALGILAQGLQEDVKQVRMVPVGPFLEPFRRLARDLARSLGKEVALQVAGEEVRVDKLLLEALRDPLTHLIRNALDHGLETPAERLDAGKPPQGSLRISVESRESQLWIEVSDDGRGIDVERVRTVAVARGALTAERARQLTDREAMNLIFTPGFSTARAITELSGRGVGLDVVRENVAGVGGRIEFYSTAGKGASFALNLPLTLAASRGLIVAAGRQLYCVPLTAVEEVLVAEETEVGLVQGHLAIQRRRQAIPYVPLEDLLAGRPSRARPGRSPTLVLALSDQRLAIAVDALHGQEEVVIKSLVPGTPRLQFVAGATALSDGRLVTVLEPAAIMAAAVGITATAVESDHRARAQATVLVADDSLTTRSLLASVLQRAGYSTVLAPDGAAALEVLRHQPIDLVVTDVEMPELDGLGLVRQMRASETLARIPAVMITSVDGPADRARGAEAGANAYIVKRAFEPGAFLALVKELIGDEAVR